MEDIVKFRKFDCPDQNFVSNLKGYNGGDGQYLSRAVSATPDGSDEEKLKWIHLRYHPPGLILQYVNESTLKEREKMIDLLKFNHFSSLDETARMLMREESLLNKNNKPTLMECLQKLKVRSKPDFKKVFQLKRSVKTHTMPILNACLSRDGSKFATASFDKTCKVWNSDTGLEIASLVGHFDAAYNCLFNTQGDKILTGSYDGTLRLWSVPQEKDAEGDNTSLPLHVFHGAQGEIEAIEYSYDGFLAAAGATDKTARVYDLTSGLTLYTFEGHVGNVTNVQFDRNCNFLCSGSCDGSVGLWDLRSGKNTKFLRGHQAEVMKCSFDFFGQTIVSCSLDKLVNVWDLRQTVKPMAILTENTDEVWDVKLNNRCRLIASGAKDGRLMIWDIQTCAVIANKDAHNSPIHQISFNAAGTHLLTCSEDPEAKIWNADAGECCQSLDGHLDKILHGSFNYLGDKILTVANDNSSHIWE